MASGTYHLFTKEEANRQKWVSDEKYGMVVQDLLNKGWVEVPEAKMTKEQKAQAGSPDIDRSTPEIPQGKAGVVAQQAAKVVAATPAAK